MIKLNVLILGVFVMVASLSFGQTSSDESSDKSTKEHYHKLFKYYKKQMDMEFDDEIYSAFLKRSVKELKKVQSWSEMTVEQKQELADNLEGYEIKYDKMSFEKVKMGLSQRAQDCIKGCMNLFPLGESDSYSNRQNCYKDCDGM